VKVRTEPIGVSEEPLRRQVRAAVAFRVGGNYLFLLEGFGWCVAKDGKLYPVLVKDGGFWRTVRAAAVAHAAEQAGIELALIGAADGHGGRGHGSLARHLQEAFGAVEALVSSGAAEVHPGAPVGRPSADSGSVGPAEPTFRLSGGGCDAGGGVGGGDGAS
jgi:hypothetical protein